MRVGNILDKKGLKFIYFVFMDIYLEIIKEVEKKNELFCYFEYCFCNSIIIFFC